MNVRKAAYVALAVAALLISGLAAAVIFGASPPPQPSAKQAAAGKIMADSLGDQPALEKFTARDGMALAFRRYQGRPGGGLVVLSHGASGSSNGTHILARALAGAGIHVLAIDQRGHGDNWPHGDIAYMGQLDDDMADLAGVLDQHYRDERRIYLGHSAGGGFALRMASGPNACAFDGYLAISPFLNFRSATMRHRAGGFTVPFTPRIIALGLLNVVGIDGLDGLPAIAFAVPPENALSQTTFYSWRLLRSFGLDMRHWQGDIMRISQPTQVLVGEKDEMFFAEKYQPELVALQPAIGVRIIAGADHMGIVQNADAAGVIVTTAQKMLKAPTDAASNCRPKSNPIGGS